MKNISKNTLEEYSMSVALELKKIEKTIWKHIHMVYGTCSEDEQQELFACGNLGLIIAMNTGNYDFSSKFSTYSRAFILHEMERYLNMKNQISYY